MSYYWIHVSRGTEFIAFGPFESTEVFHRFRTMYADDENEEGYRRSVDELPNLPGTDDQDDHESDSWIPLRADNLALEEGWATVHVRGAETFEVVTYSTDPSY